MLLKKMKEVIGKILDKKELKGLNPGLVEKIIPKYLDKEVEGIIKEKRFRNKSFKNFVSKVRAHLRRQYGAFQRPGFNRKKLIKNKKYDELLLSHQSSKERLFFYRKIYSKIFSITGKPSSIIDFGCGMNPISFEYMNLGKVNYLALDVGVDDLNIIKKYFNQKKEINGKTQIFDAKRDKFDFGKSYSVCFAFKLFEILETAKSHRLTENIFKKLPAKWVVASFSTKTLSGAPMSRSRRVWFEVMLKRLKKRFEFFQIPNEIFYVIRKN